MCTFPSVRSYNSLPWLPIIIVIVLKSTEQHVCLHILFAIVHGRRRYRLLMISKCFQSQTIKRVNFTKTFYQRYRYY